MLRIKRIYEPPAADDGCRILVDRLWPRGLLKEKAQLDTWMKELAPSDDLRRWFGHDPERWEEFQRRYRAELRSHSALLDELCRNAQQTTVTLLFAARDTQYNNAVVLKEVLESHSTKES